MKFLATQQRHFCLLAGLLLTSALPGFASPYTMKAPPAGTAITREVQVPPVSIAGNILGGAIQIYRRFVSPIQGGRCGFYPSCSTFGMHAVQHYGALQGGLMTADRLTRCNLFKQPGPDYYRRPDGRLYDPVEANLLKER